MSLELSTVAEEGIYQGAKYLKYQVLCSQKELAALFAYPFSIYPLTGIGDAEPIDKNVFLDEYGAMIDQLQQGQIPSDGALRRLFASAWTEDPKSLWKLAVPGGYLVKLRKPVVQAQAHFFTYSSLDQEFRPMTLGTEAIFWGLQLSYPQVYQDPKSHEFFEMERGGFWEEIGRWIRNYTRPTPFVVDGQKKNVPIRLGKECFSWIRCYPQLHLRGIDVDA